MRFLIFSDLHIHSHPDFDVQVDHVSSRLMDCLNVLDKVKEYYDKYQCEAVLFCGDMFHVPRAVETSVYEPAFRRLEQLTETVERFITTAGKHDKSDVTRGGPGYSSVYPVSRLSNSHVISRQVEQIQIGNIKIGGIPYIKDPDEFTASIKRFKDSDILLGHCDLKEAVNGPNEIRLKDAWPVKKLMGAGSYLFLGHHHHPQRLNKRAVVVGSPIQHNMLDRGDNRGLIIFDSDTKKLKRIWLKFSRFFLFDIESKEKLDWFLDQEWERGIENGYVRFIFRFNPGRDVISRIEEQLEAMKVRGKELKTQRAPLNSMRNEKLTLELSKSNDFKSSIPGYIDHVKPTGLNRKRLIKIGQQILEEAEY